MLINKEMNLSALAELVGDPNMPEGLAAEVRHTLAFGFGHDGRDTDDVLDWEWRRVLDEALTAWALEPYGAGEAPVTVTLTHWDAGRLRALARYFRMEPDVLAVDLMRKGWESIGGGAIEAIRAERSAVPSGW